MPNEFGISNLYKSGFLINYDLVWAHELRGQLVGWFHVARQVLGG
jgi:hypothetical protein